MFEDRTTDRVVLLVDDNPEHVRTIQNAFDPSVQVVAIATGQQALAYLQRQGKFQTAPRPNLILLELKLPDQEGHAILSTLKQDSSLKRIPTVILTHSDQPEDIFRSYTTQGNCYVIKASDPEQLNEIVARIEAFWLGIVTLPVA